MKKVMVIDNKLALTNEEIIKNWRRIEPIEERAKTFASYISDKISNNYPGLRVVKVVSDFGQRIGGISEIGYMLVKGGNTEYVHVNSNMRIDKPSGLNRLFVKQNLSNVGEPIVLCKNYVGVEFVTYKKDKAILNAVEETMKLINDEKTRKEFEFEMRDLFRYSSISLLKAISG